jgi:hypothetical protein
VDETRTRRDKEREREGWMRLRHGEIKSERERGVDETKTRREKERERENLKTQI